MGNRQWVIPPPHSDKGTRVRFTFYRFTRIFGRQFPLLKVPPVNGW